MTRRLVIPLLAVAGTVLVLLFFVLLGLGSEESVGAASDLVPVEADARASGVTGDPAYPGGVSESELPPESTLSHRGNTLNSQGEILGSWEPRGLFSGSYHSPSKNRAEPHLILTDALVFELEEGELMRAEELGWLETWNDKIGASRPVALPARLSEMVGQEVVEVEADLPQGVYVVSVSASVEEGNVRYNFRVLVE